MLGASYTDLEALGEELRFVLITSEARLEVLEQADASAAATELSELRLAISVSPDEKCERCWHRRPEVSTLSEHPTLCARCVENIDGSGETRRFA